MKIGMEKMFELSGWGKILSLITGLDNIAQILKQM